MYEAQNKAIFLDAMEKYSSGNVEAFLNILSDDHIYHASGNTVYTGKEEYRKLDSLVCITFPDQQYSVEKLITEGDWLMVLYTFKGTFKGMFKDIAPTGNKVSLLTVGTYRFSNGKIVETWGTRDMLSMLQQMGIVPER
jgi:predicted ester cyclase